YRVSPYWQEQIGNYFDTEVRFERNEIKTRRSIDSQSDNILINISSGTIFASLLWDISYNDEKISYQFGNSTRFRDLSGNLQYLLTSKLSFKASGGYEDNSYPSSSTDNDGYHWRLGGVYRPTRRTSLEVGAGKRFFGTDILVEMTYRNRRLRSSVSYFRRPETTRSSLLGIQLFPSTDEFGDPVDSNIPGDERDLDVSLPEQTAEVFIRESLRSAMSYTLRKNIFNLTVFKENRDYQINRGDEKIFGTEMNWNYIVNSTTQSSFRFQYNINESTSRDEQIFKVFEYSLKRSFGNNMEGSITYRYVDVNSGGSTLSYTQNVISINLNKVF
ncbi:MAG: TIGR03016 family PEP-CTERM system-associated outer membrane protein, partial [Gammaproteobacteria bacterium]|nr:TIGR03016 family PEP-CTERM system-associated outer membrane protein [Gammaproteobacteria bacterium]